MKRVMFCFQENGTRNIPPQAPHMVLLFPTTLIRNQDQTLQGEINPYSGDPFDIFSDWPFTQTSFVWTTWDTVSGKKTTYTSSQNPFAHTSQASPFSTQTGNSQNSTQNSNPFSYRSSPKQSSTSRSPFNDPIMSSFFGFPFYTEPPTVDKQIEDAKTLLQRDAKFLVVKFALLALCVAVGFPASGLYLYTIIFNCQGIYKRLAY